MQNGLSCKCPQNVFLFKCTAVCTSFWAICSKMQCNMLQNAVHFGAKHIAKCRKTHRVLMLNAVHFGAKRKAKCCKIQNNKHKNTPQWYKHNLLEPQETRLEWAKQPSKSGILGVKSAYLDPKNDGLATKIERQNGAKCRLYSQK